MNAEVIYDPNALQAVMFVLFEARWMVKDSG